MKNLLILAGALILANASFAGDRLLDDVESSKLGAGVKTGFYGLVAYITAKHAIEHVNQVISGERADSNLETFRKLLHAGIITGSLGYVAYKAARKTIDNAAILLNGNN